MKAAVAVEPPPGPSWWQRLGARIFGLPLPALALPAPTGPSLAVGMIHGRYPPAEVFAVRDYYTGRFYCLRPPTDYNIASGCGPVLMTMVTRRIARAELWFSPDCKHHSKAKGGEPRVHEHDPGYRREPFYGEIVRLAEVEEPRE